MGIQIGSWSPVLVSRSHSGKTQRRKRGGGSAHRWTFRYTYDHLEQSVYMDLWAFLNAQDGQYEQFTLVLPSGFSPRGTWGGAPLVAGIHAVGATSVAIDGLTININGIGKAGDFIKFNGHTKVYQLKADINSNGAGAATLTLKPGLVAALADNEVVTVSSVPFTCILTSDTSPIDLEPPMLGKIEFAAIEDF
jgi:hypothetical protein